MKLDKFVFFITSTVMLGAMMGGISGAFVDVPWYTSVIEGGMLGTNCLMGFWAFLMLDFTSSVTLPRRVWRWAEALILTVVMYDMVYWRYHYASIRDTHGHPSVTSYLLQGLVPLVVAFAAAFLKNRVSGKGHLLPTVFFVYVFTVVDWLLVLRLHAASVIDQTGFVMLACNVYMIFIYSYMLSPRDISVQQPISAANS